MIERSKARVCGRLLAGISGSNPAGGMDVCLFDCCVLSGRGPEESYWLCRVIVCDLKTWMRRLWPALGCCARRGENTFSIIWLLWQGLTGPVFRVLIGYYLRDIILQLRAVTVDLLWINLVKELDRAEVLSGNSPHILTEGTLFRYQASR